MTGRPMTFDPHAGERPSMTNDLSKRYRPAQQRHPRHLYSGMAPAVELSGVTRSAAVEGEPDPRLSLARTGV